MGFDLTGYEKDNIQLKSFGLYTIVGIIALIVVVVLTSFYIFLEIEKSYDENVTQAVIKDTDNYKKKQEQFLNSHKIKESGSKALEYYND